MALIVKTVDPNGGANYLSLAAFETAAQSLGVSGDTVRAVCTQNGPLIDTTPVVFAGWPAGVTVELIGPAGGLYRVEPAAFSAPLKTGASAPTLVVERFSFKRVNQYGVELAAAATVTLRQCVFVGNLAGVQVSLGTASLVNCLAYGNSSGVQATGGTVSTLHCTAINNGVFGFVRTGGTFTAKNCYAEAGSGLAFQALTSLTACASSDASGSVGLRNIACSTSSGARFFNVSDGTENLRIGSASALLGAGTYDASAATDFSGVTRPNPPAIGAYELPALSSVSVDSRLVVALGALGAFDSRLVMAADFASAHDSRLPLALDALAGFDTHLTAGVQFLAAHDTRLPIALDALAGYDTSLLITQSGLAVVPHDTRLVIALDALAGFDTHLTAGVQFLAAHDTRLPIALDALAGYDTSLLITQSGLAVVPHDTRLVIALDALAPCDTRLLVALDALAGYDTRLPLSADLAVGIDTRVALRLHVAVPVDTHVALALLAGQSYDTLLNLTANLSAFLAAGVSVGFATGPSYPQRATHAKAQTLDYASDGSPYIYTKGGGWRLWPLLFTAMPGATLASLEAFLAAVGGSRLPFTWQLWDGSQHIVRLAPGSRLRHRQTGPDRYRVELDLEERL